MNEVIRDAKRRIERVRKRDVEVFVCREGKPAEGARVSLRMRNHQFLFGAVCYAYGRLGDAEKEARFTQLFTGLFNYTMMPVHWNWYEPRRGQYNEPYTGNLVDWADRHGVKKKMHALLWHECCPDWVLDGMDVRALYEERILCLMRRYAGRFDFIDLVNELTVFDRFDNPVSRWLAQYGAVNATRFAARLVRACQSDVPLIYGDWNVHHDEYLTLLRDLREADADIDILGLQSHMHRELWTWEETLRVLELTSAFGWPLHFPECSICSGNPVGEMSYLPGAVNRFTETQEDLHRQAEYARDFYTLVFSHPSTEALSWFDFTDHRWLGAPAGVVDDSLNPKPVYHALKRLIHEEWRTDADRLTNAQGACAARLFCGSYDITVTHEGRETRFSRDILRPSFYAGGGKPLRLVLRLDDETKAE